VTTEALAIAAVHGRHRVGLEGVAMTGMVQGRERTATRGGTGRARAGRTVTILVALAGTALLGGCKDSAPQAQSAGHRPGVATSTGSPSTDSSAGGSGIGTDLRSAMPGGSGASTGDGGTTVGSPLPQPVATQTLTQGRAMFSSPSKNIGCAMEASYVRCDINQRSWTAPPPPPSCEFDYGNGMIISKGTAAVACTSDTVLGQEQVLGYGQAMRVGSSVCSSSPAGMRCVDQTSKHGFVLAKEGYTVF
jgi:hypothetical protein